MTNKNDSSAFAAGPRAVLGYCRAGFEPDLAAELAAHLPGRIIHADPGSGFALVVPTDARLSANRLSLDQFVFARQLVLTHEMPIALTSNDRINPLMERVLPLLAEERISALSECRVEYPDTNDGKVLSRAAKAIGPRVEDALTSEGINHDPDGPYRLHLFLTPQKQAWVGLTHAQRCPADLNGIPRLRMPGAAPSRSTLKLAEAFHIFLGDQADQHLVPEMRAVDLGAAPGGWTWQLMSRGLRITAVDNGALKGDLVDNALVRHVRSDGFKFVPTSPVDWMVCDMVEQPSRIAQLVAKWLSNGWARYIIFNLKLPMKRRLEEVDRCRNIILDADLGGRPLQLRLKQLYHDREEVTGFAMIPSRRLRDQAQRERREVRELSGAGNKPRSKTASAKVPTTPTDNPWAKVRPVAKKRAPKR
jgi:23S rRNA (cytidine2498-2'-O)-methyltransferase